MKIVLEFGEGKGGYGSIHKAGCHDVQDPETLGNAETRAEAIELASDLTGWEDDGEDPQYRFAPCTRGIAAQ